MSVEATLEEKILFLQKATQSMATHTSTCVHSIIAIESNEAGFFLGSGVIVGTDQKQWVVTAGHVLEEGQRQARRLGVSLRSGEPPCEITSAPRFSEDSDVAVIETPVLVTPPQYWPISLVDTTQDALLRDALFVHGYPAKRAYFSALLGGLKCSSLPYGVMLRDEDVPADIKDWQFAMDFDPANFRATTEEMAEWIDPHGLSGSPVWRMGARGLRIGEWTSDNSMLVGIVTQWRPDDKLIVATRIQSVLDLLEMP